MKAGFSTLLILCALSLNAQKNTSYRYQSNQKYFSVQYFGLTYHPGGGAVNMVKNYPLKMDEKAFMVLNIGVAASLDKDLSEKWFLRTEAAYYKDCAYQDAAYVHFGFRWKPLQWGRHSINGGVGPTIGVREDWHKFEGYRDTDIYGKKVFKGMQYFFIPIGGEVEYMYKINENCDFRYSVIPGYPAVITSKFGFRWKL